MWLDYKISENASSSRAPISLIGLAPFIEFQINQKGIGEVRVEGEYFLVFYEISDINDLSSTSVIIQTAECELNSRALIGNYNTLTLKYNSVSLRIEYSDMRGQWKKQLAK